MFNGSLGFETVEKIKEYCLQKKLTFKEFNGYSIRAKIYNENGSEIGFVSDASLTSFANKDLQIKWVINWT